MRIALLEMRRAKLRFGLLSIAVALLIFLILFLSALSGALISSITGAINGLDAQVFVYSDTARGNIQASRLEPSVVAKVAAVPGVSGAGAVAVATVTTQTAAIGNDLQLFSFENGKPGEPTGVVQGRLPTASNEVAMDGPVAIGSTVEVGTAVTPLKVVGLLKGAQFGALPTGYITMATYESLLRSNNPAAAIVPINAVAVDVTDADAVQAVASSISSQVPGTAGYAKADAVAAIPGAESITQTFGILVALTFIIGITVIGFFFLILTVQKLRVFTMLRAIGSSTRSLAISLSVQIAVVVLVASAIALAMVIPALQGMSSGIPVALEPATAIETVALVLIASLVTGLLSVRRIAKIEPASAVGGQ